MKNIDILEYTVPSKNRPTPKDNNNILFLNGFTNITNESKSVIVFKINKLID